jgi:phosphoribosyl 1,2-cyclic phosphate phosphodiesterase
VIHGKLPVTAYRMGGFAYVTDCNHIPDETCDRLSGLDVLVIDALRLKKHPTHMALDEALGYIERLRPRRALLTHISHDIRHAPTSAILPAGVEIAYDGQVIVMSDE